MNFANRRSSAQRLLHPEQSRPAQPRAVDQRAEHRPAHSGPYTETYFEHAYIARHLGYPLVEGSDLTVRDRQRFPEDARGSAAGGRDHSPRGRHLVRSAGNARRFHPRRARPGGSGARRQRGDLECARHRGGRDHSAARLFARAGAAPLGEKLLHSQCGNVVVRPGKRTQLRLGGARSARRETRVRRRPRRAEFWRKLEARSSRSWPPAFAPARTPTLARSASPFPPRRSGMATRSSRARSSCAASSARRPRVSPSCPAGSPASPRGRIRPSCLRAMAAAARTPGSLPGHRWKRRAAGDEASRCNPSATAHVPSRSAENLFWLGRYAERLEDTTRMLRTALGRLAGEGGRSRNRNSPRSPRGWRVPIFCRAGSRGVSPPRISRPSCARWSSSATVGSDPRSARERRAFSPRTCATGSPATPGASSISCRPSFPRRCPRPRPARSCSTLHRSFSSSRPSAGWRWRT